MKFFLKPKLALLLLAVAAAHSAQAQDTLKVTLQEAVRIASVSYTHLTLPTKLEV